MNLKKEKEMRCNTIEELKRKKEGKKSEKVEKKEGMIKISKRRVKEKERKKEWK